MNESATTVYSYHASPIGDLLLTWDEGALSGLSLVLKHGKEARRPDPRWRQDAAALRAVHDQLRAYFAGELRTFDLPLGMAGTPFQRQVWDGLLGISFGMKVSYAELARRIGRPGAARAVGAANGQNPIGIIVPCHRVIAADGTLGGYGGGLERKDWLLSHEASVLDRQVRPQPRARYVVTRPSME
jgi:methylated-DNA-[protein]-cysteine S-methyltransferase